MVAKFLLDTNVVIYLLGGRIRHAFPQGDFGVSVITEIELLSYQGLSQADEEIARGFLDEVVRYPLTDAVRDQTILLRRQFRLKLPDALVAATALEAGATLLSNDQQLQVVSSLKVQAVELA